MTAGEPHMISRLETVPVKKISLFFTPDGFSQVKTQPVLYPISLRQ
jgi:hypothetical protein